MYNQAQHGPRGGKGAGSVFLSIKKGSHSAQ